MERIKEIMLPELNGGLNVNDPEYAILDSQSHDMLNMWYRGKSLVKRNGQALLDCGIAGEVQSISPLYCDYYVVHSNDRLYKWRGNEAQLLKSGVASAEGVFCEFCGTLYYLDGNEIWEIAPDFSVKEARPYIPVVIINAHPDLSGGDDNEAYNIIGAGFCVKYNGDKTSAVYSLPQKEIDETAVLVSIDAADLTEGEHFSVDRTQGTVNFAEGTSPNGPPGAGTNNVWISAFKTVPENKRKITGCKIALPFGGEASGIFGGTRVFVTGNPKHARTYWHSDLGHGLGSGMRYFPDTCEEHLNQNNQPITAAAKMGGELVLFKQSSIFVLGYVFDGVDAFYPVRECHSAIGCDMPKSLALIDNALVFANSSSGVHMLTSTDNKSENVVKPLSANINKLLLSEPGLRDACSIDHGRYYWLCAGGRAYLWDYEQTPFYDFADYKKAQRRLAWYRFDNIDANVLCADADTLYYGGKKGIVLFCKNKSDFGRKYDAYFTTKAFDLMCPNRLKTFLKVYPSFAAQGNIKATVTISSETHDVFSKRVFDIKSFSWLDFNWSTFTFDVIKFSRTYVVRLSMRRAAYIQIRVSGSDKDRDVGISALRIEYCFNNKLRR